MNRLVALLFLALTLLSAPPLCAQTEPADTIAPHKSQRIDRRFERFVKKFIDFNNYDTAYISPNRYNYAVMLCNNSIFESYHIGTTEPRRQQFRFAPNPSYKIGAYFGWRWIFLGYTFDVAHPRSLGKASELSFRLYSSMLGCDFVYMQNKGGYSLRKAMGFEGVEPKSVRGVDFTGMNSSMLSFSAYYVFNHRHFSYPAAFNQSTQQLKSCGSPMAGLGYSRQDISFDHHKLPASLLGEDGSESKLIDELKFSSVNYDYYYLSGGYAYNWVFARNWLLGGSFMTSVGIRKAKGKKLKGNELLLDLKNFSFDCTSRVGLVWNNSHWFAGASFINHLYTYRNSRLSLTNSINYCNAYVGFFFGRKKK